MRGCATPGVVLGVALALGCSRAPSDGTARPAPPPPSPAPPPVAMGSSETAAAADAGTAREDAPAPPLENAFAVPATPNNPSDLAWLTELVRTLAARKVSREQVIAFLGTDIGQSPNDSRRRRVKPHSPYLASVEVYALAHVHIDVAVDLEFAKDARPNRSAMENAVGALTPMPRNPDDFSSGPKLAHYERGGYATARVFVELDAEDSTRVAKVHVDADGVKQ